MGSPTRKLTPEMAQEEHKVLQELVDQSFGEFKEIVTASRPQLAKDADKLAAAGTQLAPAVDAGYVGNAVVMVGFGAV